MALTFTMVGNHSALADFHLTQSELSGKWLFYREHDAY